MQPLLRAFCGVAGASRVTARRCLAGAQVAATERLQLFTGSARQYSEGPVGRPPVLTDGGVYKIGDVRAVAKSEEVPPEIAALAEERQAARKVRDFTRADQIRDQLIAQGWNTVDPMRAIYDKVKEDGMPYDPATPYKSVLRVRAVAKSKEVPPEIAALAEERQAARKVRDFTRADQIRDQLIAQGWKTDGMPYDPATPYKSVLRDVRAVAKSEEVPPEIAALAEERQAACKVRDFTRADQIRDQLIAQGWNTVDPMRAIYDNGMPYDPATPYKSVLWTNRAEPSPDDVASMTSAGRAISYGDQRKNYRQKLTQLRKGFATELRKRESYARAADVGFKTERAAAVAQYKAERAEERAATRAWRAKLLEAKKASDVEEALQRTERHRVFWEAKALEKKMCLSKQEALSSRFLSLDAAERAQQIDDLLEDEVSYNSLERKY